MTRKSFIHSLLVAPFAGLVGKIWPKPVATAAITKAIETPETMVWTMTYKDWETGETITKELVGYKWDLVKE